MFRRFTDFFSNGNGQGDVIESVPLTPEQIENINTDTVYSTLDRLSDRAKASFSDGGGSGAAILTGIVLLSGILSALFFWQNASAVFRNVWPPLAIILALAVGLLPNEGAFFGWRKIRETKHDMTQKQLDVTTTGIVAAVAGSIFGTFALFVISFPYVPAEILAYKDWLAFIALGLPIMVQVALAAKFSTNERATVENFEYAKLSAMGFNNFIKAEQARMQAIVDGQARALSELLESYGAVVGSRQADNLLRDGSQELLNMGRSNQPQVTVFPAETHPASVSITTPEREPVPSNERSTQSNGSNFPLR